MVGRSSGPPSQPPAKPTASKERPTPNLVDLRLAVSSLVLSVLSSRVALDQQTAQLALLYERDELLRQFPVPAFAIGEVKLRLPYAAVEVVPPQREERKAEDPREIPQMLVHLNADWLARLPEHAVSYVELTLNQQQLALLLGEQERPQ